MMEGQEVRECQVGEGEKEGEERDDGELVDGPA